jgi:hypothetical protein
VNDNQPRIVALADPRLAAEAARMLRDGTLRLTVDDAALATLEVEHWLRQCELSIAQELERVARTVS